MAGKACLSPVGLFLWGRPTARSLGERNKQGIGLGSEARPLPLVPSVALPTKLGKRGILLVNRAC